MRLFILGGVVKMIELETVKLEIVKFMRGKYRLDEIAGMYYGTPCLKFRQGKKTILSINFHEDYYDFQIIFGKAEREKFEEVKHEFPKVIQEIYDRERTLHDGKWLLIRVDNLSILEAVKKLIQIKKKPNRKPLSKENAVYSKCGHRCDLCIHYEGISEDFRTMITPHLVNVYGDGWSDRCPGCGVQEVGKPHPCMGGDWCEELKCAKRKGLTACVDCKEYPCHKATAGYKGLEHRNISADDVTWAILPYVPYQYE